MTDQSQRPSYIFKFYFEPWVAFDIAQIVKNLPAMQEMQETWVLSLDWEDPLEEEMATHPVFLLLGISYGQRRLLGYNL